MTTFKSAARGGAEGKTMKAARGGRGRGLAGKIPPALKAKFEEAAAAGKAGDFGKAAGIYAGVARKAGEKGKNGIAARAGLRAVKAYVKAKDMPNAGKALKFAVGKAAQAKNREKMLGRIRGLHAKLTAKGRDKAATMLASEVKQAFGVDL